MLRDLLFCSLPDDNTPSSVSIFCALCAHMFSIYLDSSSGPSLNTEHVFLHNHCQECLQACTEMYSHIHSLWEYLWEETVHFHSISLSPIFSTYCPFPHHPHICEICALTTQHHLTRTMHSAQCSAQSPQESLQSWYFIYVDTLAAVCLWSFVYSSVSESNQSDPLHLVLY